VSDTEITQETITDLLSLEKLLAQRREQPNGPAKSSMLDLFDKAAKSRTFA
jgi:hypothetical protein